MPTSAVEWAGVGWLPLARRDHRGDGGLCTDQAAPRCGRGRREVLVFQRAIAEGGTVRCMREYDLNSDNKISIDEWNKVEEHFFEEVNPTRCLTHASQFYAVDNQAELVAGVGLGEGHPGRLRD